MKIKLLALTLIFSCSTMNYKESKEDFKEPSFCKNTLQRDIHRYECMR